MIKYHSMDSDGMHLEDMLFGLDAPGSDHEEAASDNTDDEMLEDADDEDPNLWDLDDEPLLMPGTTDHEVEEHTDLMAAQPQHPQKGTSALGAQPVRDR
jgi:hypothetical protein